MTEEQQARLKAYTKGSNDAQAIQRERPGFPPATVLEWAEAEVERQAIPVENRNSYVAGYVTCYQLEERNRKSKERFEKMLSWKCEPGNVFLVRYKGRETLVRVAEYNGEGERDITLLYCNLRVAGGLRWGVRLIKVSKELIIKDLPSWYEEQHAAWEASIKATADAAYARMTPAQKEQVAVAAKKRRARSPLDIMIDRACGIE